MNAENLAAGPRRTDPSTAPIGIVVVNYACSDLIDRNLGAVALVHARVVVVDNYSSTPERDRVRELTRRRGWTLVENPDNRGFGPGVNAGARAARALGCGSILLLNPDVEVSGEVVESLRRECAARPLSLVSPVLVDLAGKVVFEGSSLDLADGRIRNAAKADADPAPGGRPMRWLTAGCLAVDLRLWEWVGGFDEGYFMYWEDVDFNLRALAAGGHLVLRRDLVARHDQGGTQGPRVGRAKSGLYYYYNCRNRMLFAVRHLGPRRVLAWWLRTPKVSYEIWLRGGRRQLLASPDRLGWAVRGAVAGMAGALRYLVLSKPRTNSGENPQD